MIKIQKQKGMTLIETVIYVAIIGLIITSFISFVLNISNNREKNYVITEVQYNLRNATDLISRQIRESESVNVDDSDFNTDPGILFLSKNESAKDPTVISLDQDDGFLQIKEDTNPAIKITSDQVNVTNLFFSDLSTENEREIIQFNLTIEYNNPDGDLIYDYKQSATTTVNLRQ